MIDYFLRRYLNRLSESNEDMKQALFEQAWNVDPNVQIDQDLIISLYGKYSSFNGIFFKYYTVSHILYTRIMFYKQRFLRLSSQFFERNKQQE